MNLIAATTQPVSLALTDTTGAAVNLTGATEVRAIFTGPATIGPVACTVTNAASGVVSVPLTATDKLTPGNYGYEIEARWGAVRVSGTGSMVLRHLNPPVIGVIQGDSPTIILQISGVNLTAATAVAFIWGSTPATAITAINGVLTIPPAGGSNDQVAITLAATDTASAGVMHGRLMIDGIYTTPIRINIQSQGLI